MPTLRAFVAVFVVVLTLSIAGCGGPAPRDGRVELSRETRTEVVGGVDGSLQLSEEPSSGTPGSGAPGAELEATGRPGSGAPGPGNPASEGPEARGGGPSDPIGAARDPTRQAPPRELHAAKEDGGEGPSGDDVLAAPRREGAAAGSPGAGAKDERQPAEAVTYARDVLRRLQGGIEDAERAFRAFRSVPVEVLPLLMREVQNPARTELRQLDVVVLQERFAPYDASEGRFYYDIHGLGSFALDDIAVGPLPRSKGWRARIRNFEGFPLGVVVRAGLLNRFRSWEHPRFSDKADVGRWWQAYYDLTFRAPRTR